MRGGLRESELDPQAGDALRESCTHFGCGWIVRERALMDAWDGWDFQRFYLLFVAAAFVLIGLQVLFFHWRAAFSKWTMYLPVLASPVLALAGIVAAITREGAIGWLALAVFAVGIVDGAVGVYEHLRGVAGRIGGFTPRNIVAGPPVLLPATFAAVSFSAGLAILWGGL